MLLLLVAAAGGCVSVEVGGSMDEVGRGVTVPWVAEAVAAGVSVTVELDGSMGVAAAAACQRVIESVAAINVGTRRIVELYSLQFAGMHEVQGKAGSMLARFLRRNNVT